MSEKNTVDKQANVQATSNLTPAQEALQELWEEHLGYEFGTHSTEDALATMVEDA
jgi:carboxymethylenebutenolidase